MFSLQFQRFWLLQRLLRILNSTFDCFIVVFKKADLLGYF